MNLSWSLKLLYDIGRVFSFLVLQMKKILKFMGFKCFSQVHIVTKLFSLGQEEWFYFYKASASLIRLHVFWRITCFTQTTKFLNSVLWEPDWKYWIISTQLRSLKGSDFKENNTRWNYFSDWYTIINKL